MKRHLKYKIKIFHISQNFDIGNRKLKNETFILINSQYMGKIRGLNPHSRNENRK